ncbi:MAG TPA: papain-like cysteine protease family protein [Gemmatimonadaceae bacterium]
MTLPAALEATPPTPMSSTKSVLVTVAEVVVFLFAGFNGYLKLAAPPAGRVGGMSGEAAVGFASFGALLIFLFAKTWIPSRFAAPSMRTAWLRITSVLVAAYFAAGLLYQRTLDRYTFYFPLGNPAAREVLGKNRTKLGESVFQQLQKQNERAPLPAEMIQSIGEPPSAANTKLWEPQSIQDAQNSLIYAYVGFIVILASSIARLIELQLVANPQAGAGARAETNTAEGPKQTANLAPQVSSLLRSVSPSVAQARESIGADRFDATGQGRRPDIDLGAHSDNGSDVAAANQPGISAEVALEESPSDLQLEPELNAGIEPAHPSTIMITPVEQENTQWCWAACIEMVLAAKGESHRQAEIASRVLGHDCVAHPDSPECNTQLEINGGRDIAFAFEKWNVTARFRDGRPSAGEAIDDLITGPFVACFSDGGTDGHVVLVTQHVGGSGPSATFLVNDPRITPPRVQALTYTDLQIGNGLGSGGWSASILVTL